MNTLNMFSHLAPAVTTVAALVLPWTAVLAMHALSMAAGSPRDGVFGSKLQLRA